MTNRITEHFNNMDELLSADVPFGWGDGVFLYLSTALLADEIHENLSVICEELDAPHTSTAVRGYFLRAQAALLAFKRRMYSDGLGPLFYRLDMAKVAGEDDQCDGETI